MDPSLTSVRRRTRSGDAAPGHDVSRARAPLAALGRAARRQRDAYEGPGGPSVAAYLPLAGAYLGLVGGLGLLARRRGGTPTGRLEPYDLGLVALGTARAARLLSKDAVTSPLRAPFTRFKEVQGPAELGEEVRGRGVRHAVGELVTCPFCLNQWIATVAVFGLVLAPRPTRLALGLFSGVALADVAQLGWSRAQQAVEG